MVCFQILPKMVKTHSYTHKFYHIPMELSREIEKISTYGHKTKWYDLDKTDKQCDNKHSESYASTFCGQEYFNAMQAINLS